MKIENVLLRTFCRLRASLHQYRNFHRDVVKEAPASGRKYVTRMEFKTNAEIKNISTCKSHKLFLLHNILQPCHTGAYHYMPKGLRALEKLIRIVDEELQSIGAQKMSMPTMMQAHLWKSTGRWVTNELFKLSDRHNKEFCLGPTHEESITSLVAEFSNTLSAKRLPIMVYQNTRKFRDEMSPKYGLLRGREFEMKDMYTFDSNIETATQTYNLVCDTYDRIFKRLGLKFVKEAATQTYNLVCDTYDRIFKRLGLKFVKVKGATGNIGGELSHEYHLPADIGEDSILVCKKCGFGTNTELLESSPLNEMSCPEMTEKSLTECQSTLTKSPGIEVGHAFLLGTKYSKVFDAYYNDVYGKKLCEMGCYGLGISRILQASTEVLSTETELKWPPLMAPYQICIIPQKVGFAYEKTFKAAEDLNDHLNKLPNLKNEVVIDDRTNLTIGRRVQSAKAEGYPFIIAAGKKALESPIVYEFIDTNKETTEHLTLEQITDKVSVIETVQVV